MSVSLPAPGARVIDTRRDTRKSIGSVVEPGPGDPARPEGPAPVVLVAWPRIDHGPVREWTEVGHLQVLGGGVPASN